MNLFKYLENRKELEEYTKKHPEGFTAGCICTNCGYRWSRQLEWPYVCKNSLEEYDDCEKCRK